MLMNGAFLKEGEQVGMIDTETGREQIDQLRMNGSLLHPKLKKKSQRPILTKKSLKNSKDTQISLKMKEEDFRKR